MDSWKKNVLVAITVLGAFAAVGWMIIQFGGTLGNWIGGGGYQVRMTAPRVDGLAAGNRVQYLGLPVGRVESISLNDNLDGFDVVLLMRPESRVPQNVVGVIRATNLISGGAAVDLDPDGSPTADLLADGDRIIAGEFGGADLIPPEISELADEVRELVSEFREAGLVDNVNEQARKIGQLADSLNAVVADEDLRADVKASVASIREAAAASSETAEEFRKFAVRLNELQDQADTLFADANEISGEVKLAVTDVRATATSARETIDRTSSDVQKITGQLVARLDQAQKIMARVESITAKIDNGEGTLGKFLNDPSVYQTLDTDLLILREILRDTERLVQQIEEEGFKLSVF